MVRGPEQDVTAGPDNPLIIRGETPVNLEPPDLGLLFNEPAVEGNWRVAVDDTPVMAFDFHLADIFDDDGNMVYFFPAFLIEAETATRKITGVQIRWYSWSPEIQSYLWLDAVTDSLPLVGTWSASWGTYTDTDEDAFELAVVDGQIVLPSVDVFVPPAGDGLRLLENITVQYNTSNDIGISFVWIIQADNL